MKFYICVTFTLDSHFNVFSISLMKNNQEKAGAGSAFIMNLSISLYTNNKVTHIRPYADIYECKCCALA